MYVNNKYSLTKYFDNIFETINYFNTKINKYHGIKDIYIWPSSIHSLFLITFGLEHNKLTGILDNSLNKIGKKMYGTNLIISSFRNIINNNQNILLLMNGGIFNNEVINELENLKIEYITNK